MIALQAYKKKRIEEEEEQLKELKSAGKVRGGRGERRMLDVADVDVSCPTRSPA